MPAPYKLLFGAVLLLLVESIAAAPREYLFKNERVCDTSGAFCMHGTFSYQPNPRLLHLRARVQSAPGSGMLKIRLSGSNDLGHQRYTFLEVAVRGNHSEIINHKMVPDYPDVNNWAIDQVTFVADS